MIETVKSIVLYFKKMRTEAGVPRCLRIETVRSKATVCIGIED
jgi:hypothetical protein